MLIHLNSSQMHSGVENTSAVVFYKVLFLYICSLLTKVLMRILTQVHFQV